MKPNDPGATPPPHEQPLLPGVRDSAGYLKARDLQARGWTETLIRRFLPAPDATQSNPRHRSGPPIRLYLPAHVEAIEADADFLAARAKSAGRRAGAAKAVATKRDALRAYVERLVVVVPTIPAAELVRRACEHANARRPDFGDAEPFSPKSDPDHLDRICVNYLRHEMTDYEAELERIAGKVGAADAYLDVRAEVLDAIGDAYPDLGRECHRQEQKAVDEAFWADIDRLRYR